MSQSERVRTFDAAGEFLSSRMAVADLVAVLTYSGGTVRVVQEFTDDRVRLQASLQRLRDGNDSDEGALIPASAQSPTNFDIFATDRRLKSLETAAKMLASLAEAKSLIYFSSGVGLGVDNQAQLRATVNAANRANVSIFPIDSRGLSAFAPLGNASQSSPSGIAAYMAASAMEGVDSFQRSQDALFTLAADTGGRAFFDSNDLTAGIVEAQHATSGYYILGYYPTDKNQDGGLRQVSIRLKDHPGNVSYQEAYYAHKDFSHYTAEDRERQLEEALLLGNPVTDLTMAVQSNYFRMNETGNFVSVAVRIPGNELALAGREGATRSQIDFVGEIKDDTGVRITSLREQVEISLTGIAEGLLASRLVQYDTGFVLRAGRYTLKLLARNADTGRMGTYQSTLVIPELDTSRARLPISSVVLGSQHVDMAEALFNADVDQAAEGGVFNPLVRNGQKLIPSISRVFSKGEPLYVYLEAYPKNDSGAATLVTIVTFYKNQEGALETLQYVIQRPAGDASRVVPVALTVGLDQFAPGEYTCQVTVLNPNDQNVAFWQAPVLIGP